MHYQEMTAIQLAAAYAAYEIIGSNFHKCQFLSPFEEQKLKICFSGKKLDKQYELENRILAYLNKHPLADTDLACEVSHYIDGDKYVLVFQTYFSNFTITIKPNGWPVDIQEAV